MTKNKFQSKELDKLRLKAEERMGSIINNNPELSPDKLSEIVHELQTYQIELELQNEELLQAQDQLATIHEQYIDLYDHAPVGYLSLNNKNLIVKVNLTMANKLKMERSLLINQPITKFIHPQDQDTFHKIYRKILKCKSRQECDIRILKKDGHPFWVKLECVLQEINKEDSHLRIAVTDISKLKKAEKIMQAANQRYRSYIEITGHLGWTTNAGGEVVEDLPTWRKFTGQSEKEIMGWGWSAALHPDDIDPIIQLWKLSVASKSNYECEYRVRRYDGEYRYFLARGVPVLNKVGEIMEWVGTCIDITDRKKTEDLINQTNIELERRVAERTIQLARRTKRLEDTNIALQVLLDKREKDKSEQETQILNQVKYLIEPTLMNLKEHCSTVDQKTLFDILQTNLQEITSPFVNKMSGLEMKLTPIQIQVADMIKQGMSSKGIAGVLHIAPGTVEIHRKNIRKKLGLTNRKINLKTFLTSQL